jgi:hypothetical protein
MGAPVPPVPCSTLVDTHAMVSSDMGAPVRNPTAYHRLTGALQYLTLTRPDIAYAIQQVCLHMHDHHEPHLMTCFFIVPLHWTSLSTLMLTGLVVPTLAGPLRAKRCS